MAPQTWNGPSTATPPDVWHVLVGPGETKVLSLEQLDDFFRLEVIDASTKVWQPGMKEWLPLSVVAGLEDEPAPLPAPRKPPAPPSRAPSPPSRPASPPQRAAAPMPQTAAVAAPLPAPVASAYPPAASAYPPAASAYTGAPITPYVAPVRNAAPAFAAPESTRPMVLGNSASMRPQTTGRGGSVLLGFAMLAAVGITLYRNDMLRDLAKSAGQEAAYQQVERTLGSPGFGTPRAVAHLAELTPSNAELNTPAVAAAALPVEPAAPAKAIADSDRSGASEPESEARAAESSKSPRSLESLVAAQVGATPAAKRPARSPQPTVPARQKRAEPSEKSLGLKGSTNRFDPLNDKL